MIRAIVMAALVLGVGTAVAGVWSEAPRERSLSGAPSPAGGESPEGQGLAVSQVFSSAGAGERRAANGLAASEVELSSSPWLVAARRDGLIALATDHKLFWVREGRLRGAGVNTRWARDLAFAPDGSLVLATCGSTSRQPSAVYRVVPDARPRPVRHGLPAPLARFASRSADRAGSCPLGVDVQPDGTILVADWSANRVRRIAADGTVATVAGTGRPGRGGDGGSAMAASLLGPSDVAVLPDGAT